MNKEIKFTLIIAANSLLLAGCGTTGKVATSEPPRTYNLSADWSNDTNPNGVWSYNLNNEPLAKLQTYWWGQAGWGGGPLGDGCIIKGSPPREGTKDPTGRLQARAHDWRDGDVMMHSLSGPYGGDTRFVSACWTSPADGKIDISGRAWDGFIFPEREIGWSLIVNGQTIAQRSAVRGICRTDKAAKFSANVVRHHSLTGIPIRKGEVVEFRVATVTTYGHFVGIEEQIKLKPILLAGRCTTNRATEWEYKVASPKGNWNVESVLESFLNDMAQDGWTLDQKVPSGAFIFKRAKKSAGSR